MAIPYGFKKMADGNVKLVTSEIEVVQRIYQRYVNDSSLGGITAELEGDQVVAPSGNAKWSCSVIDRILSNSGYVPYAVPMELFVAAQFKKNTCTNIQTNNDGAIQRKTTRYSSQNAKLALNDELDHLGMFAKHNCYPRQTDIIPKGAIGNFFGYREELDNYFCKLYHPQLSPEKPLPDITDLFLRIIHYLEVKAIPGRSFISNYLLNFAPDAKEDFCTQVNYVINRQKQVKCEIPIHAAGIGEYSLRYTCFVSQQGIVEPSDAVKREYTLACLSWNNDPDRCLIDLSFDVAGNFTKIRFKQFTAQDIASDELEKIKQLGIELAEKRTLKYRQLHKEKIGRNQLCPCGSGKKHKRCCGC